MLDIEALLKALHAANVQFVIVGDMAAAAHGLSSPRGFLELNYERSRANCERVVRALAPLKLTLRGTPLDLPFQWDATTLLNGSNFTLSTKAGPIDLIGAVSGLGDYAAVKAQAETFELYGRTTWVLGLEGLIRSKEATRRVKDERMLPELRSLRVLRDQKAADEAGRA